LHANIHTYTHIFPHADIVNRWTPMITHAHTPHMRIHAHTHMRTLYCRLVVFHTA